jgi:rhodanese-related sulfurtransferase
MRLPLALLALLAALALAACGGDDGGGDGTSMATATAPAFTEVSVQDAAAKADEGALLVDVREDDEWEAGHAPDAVHVPLGDLTDAKLAELDEQRGDGELIFICRSGNRSGQAAAAAQAAGLDDVVSVAGGMGDWVTAGLPLEPENGEII